MGAAIPPCKLSVIQDTGLPDVPIGFTVCSLAKAIQTGMVVYEGSNIERFGDGGVVIVIQDTGKKSV